jgi:transcriptional regulator with XRE-family HTH domain
MDEGQRRFGANLKAARTALGWSQDKLAGEADTSKGYLSDLERGLRPMPPGRKLAQIAEALGVTTEQLVGPDGPRRTTVPLVGYVGAGAEAHFYGSGDEGLGEVEAPEGSTDQTRAAEIRGESLGPLFDSWLVFYDDVRTPVTPDLLGRLCIVGLPNDKVLVKKIQRSRTPGLYHLLSNNEAPMLDQEVVWAARVRSMTPR